VGLLCTGPNGTRADYVVTMSAGHSQGSTNFAQRFLRRSGSPSDPLNYNLYLETVAPANIWGDGTGGSTRWTGRTQPINQGNPQRVANANLIGVLAAGLVPSAGSYGDTIVVTATWN
jgi:spore coat protein U-like protein